MKAFLQRRAMLYCTYKLKRVFIIGGKEETMAEGELEQIGPYSITNVLHTSPTSILYQGKLRRKTLLVQRLTTPLRTQKSKEAFLARSKQLKKLRHRHIVNVLDASFDGDYAYLVMEFFSGETLAQSLTPGTRLAPDEVKPLLSPIAGALHYAHLSHTLHGNLHPGTLFRDKQHSPMLTGFSLLLPDTLSTLADDTLALPYMAPEYLQGSPSLASDQYSLAVMVYEWLCGRRPYEATQPDLLLEQQQSPPPEPRSLNPALSSAVERVLLQALSYTAQERFPQIQDFADAYLSALMGFPFKAKVESRPLVSPLPTPASTKADRVEHSSPLPPQPSPVMSLLRTSQSTSQMIAESSPDDLSNSSPKHKPDLAPAPDQGASQASSPPKAQQAHTELQEDSSSLRAAPKHPTSGARSYEARLQAMINADLRQGGSLSRSLPGYEERPAQIDMATLVARSLTQHVPAIIEAGTGTGKSLAYLVPIVRSGKVAIISTANKALQEQLFYKDIPFVQQHISQFEAALVKGVSNYVCRDRVENERVGMQFYSKNREFQRLLDIVNDPESSFSGDFETLGFQLPNDLRGRVSTDSDQCAWNKCGFFSECYVRQMRERAEMAQVIVVNHTLLLLDAAIGGFLLPERDVIVLDEAHHLEEEATRSFTVTVSPVQIQTLLAQRMLKDFSAPRLQDEVFKAAQETWETLMVVADPGYKGRVNLEAPLEEGLRLASVLSDLADSLRKQRPKDMPEKEGQFFEKLLKRTQNLAENARTVFSVSQQQQFVYFVDRVESSGSRTFQLQASAAPLDVNTWLKERLFEKCPVICTSATLATVSLNAARAEDKEANFAYFRRSIGLDSSHYADTLEGILPLTFDYEHNALLYLPRDLPAPTYGIGSEDYMKAIAREMYRLVKLSRGRAFLLFSSRRMLERAYELMQPHLSFPLLKQGDMTRIELTRRFREAEGAVLFGLKSFWEGVDIAGDALSLVVIDKLPFDPPDDPVHEARVNQMKAAGENWFGAYVLPQAVLRLKQGIGRLLRTRTDRGVMAILDTRLHTKGYGKQVLSALPPAQRTSSLRDVERFFAQ